MSAKQSSNLVPRILLTLFFVYILVRLFSGGLFLSAPDIQVSEGEEMTIRDLRTLAGETRSLSDWEGKVVVINFWATWCPPCVAEMPNLVSLREKTQEQPIEVLCVSDETSREVEAFVEKEGYPREMFLLSPSDGERWTPDGIPRTYILGREGKIRGTHLGAAAWDDEKVLNLLSNLAQSGV